MSHKFYHISYTDNSWKKLIFKILAYHCVLRVHVRRSIYWRSSTYKYHAKTGTFKPEVPEHEL